MKSELKVLCIEKCHKEYYPTMVCSSDAAVLIEIICSLCKLSASLSQFGEARTPHDAEK